ncbi:MAG: cyclic nucleotide-binding domain-containing protein [Alphaproteobacteria bacterium]|nr:cyclic nucleotide-binding domain-containing protein [Alphaproteobacteria bacterium]
MRYVRTGLLIAWFVLIVSLFWDPITPFLTMPENTWSPFHLRPDAAPVMVQGHPLAATPYAMGNRMWWTMVLPLVPIFLMVFGHEAWRRVCPLSHFSQIPHMLGWQHKIKTLNRRSGRVDRVLALLPQGWLRRNNYYLQLAFLTAGVCARLLFVNADRIALVGIFAFMLGFALIIGLLYGGKTWCNYFCPIAVIQDIYTGPGGLVESKAHLAGTPVSQSMCRAPGPRGDQSICVACTTNCPDIDVENSYWRTLDSDPKRFMYYGFFGLVWAFYSYYWVYSGGWDYYFTGAWTHESGQMGKLLDPGFYMGGVAIPIPKIIAAPLYLTVCVLLSYWLWVLIERGYARFAAARGRPLSKARLRHQMLSVCAFLTFNLFYIFAGRPNILLMPSWAIKLIDVLFIFVSTTWLIRSLRRDAELYSHERVARSLRDQLARMGFRSEEVLEGRALDQLSADEVYVLAKTLPNFSTAQKREAYRAILGEALEGGHAQSAESLEILKDLRTQLGLTEADHHAITESLGIQDPALLDPEARGSIEVQVRRENYRKFLTDLVERDCPPSVRPADFLATSKALEAAAPVRSFFGISDEDHARIVGEIGGDETRIIDSARAMLEKLRELEIVRFSLIVDPRPEALLIRQTLLMTQRGLIREIVSIIASIADLQIARSFAQSLYVLRGDDSDPATADVIEAAPAEIRDAFIEMTSDPVLWSYLDVIEASKPPAEVFGSLARDRDPVVAALAISAVAGTDRALAEAPAAELMERIKTPSALIEEALAAVVQGRRSETIAKMAELLAAEVFASVNLDTLAQIARQSKRVTFRVGEQICRFGESSDSFFVLVRGETEAYVEGENGRTVFRRAQSGAVFGELGVYTGRPRTASIEVVSATAEVIEVPRDVIDNLLNRDLHATRAVLSVVSSYLLGPAPVPTEPSRSIEAMAEAAQ